MSRESLAIGWAQSRKDDPTMLSFLDLPKELRNMIYDYAFQVSGAVFIYCYDPRAWKSVVKGKIVKYKNEGPSEPQRLDGVIPTNLLLTSKQIYTEGAEVLYGHNVFRLYTSSADFAPTSYHLVRHVAFTIEAGRGIYKTNLEVMSYWWRRVFWPNVIDKSTELLDRYPNLQTLTFPIKSDQAGVTWRPAFLASQKTKEHRIALAARWLAINCPMKDERLRKVLHLEIMPSSGLTKKDFEGSQFHYVEEEDEYDGSELAEAFELMKSYLIRQA
ncbi:hypothetical protein P171DRAFT_164577 [Karstenula rhodostoma CBS 690.94]|uniref:DUF7730 domain-containing protein n=1 Tax=Karstenula rhodostoma CBS 690.94 TaxID=1392251 RepID=A0A9P4P839_9PLEO|nr:hypothetical protein P171DRAFT_164577 [Karstenula rhodostoma CBS 690.94]